MDADLTVVTVSLNPGKVLQCCLDSVALQKGVRCRHIVVDGGSTDGTLQLLENRDDPCLTFSSQPDGGIADAMNKGARQAEGDWLVFLQADDELADEYALHSVLQAVGGREVDLVASAVRIGDRSSFPCQPGTSRFGWPPASPFKQPFRHQGLLVSRTAWRRVGAYDPTFRITMDFDWLLRAFWLRASVIRVGCLLSRVGPFGISSSRERDWLLRRLREEHRARMKNAPNPAWAAGYRVFWWVYRPYRMMRTGMSAS